MNASQKKAEPNRFGHIMTAKGKPSLDDEGDYTSYAACAKCGAEENDDEIIKPCPK